MNWLRVKLRNWLGITAMESRAVLRDGEDSPAMARIAQLEFELKAQEEAHQVDIAEIRERLDNRGARAINPHRPFQQMRKIAEMGEQFMRSRDGG